MNTSDIGNHCSICNKDYDRFADFGTPVRQGVLCPGCRSLERHRLLWLYWQNETNLFNAERPLRVLHFAPEKAYFQRFLGMGHIEYFPCDLHPEHYTGLEGAVVQQADITAIPYPDDHFDVIVCNHVLEHIPDDQQAMKELRRVMKQTGWGVFQVPIKYTLETTYEDFSITSPEERAKAFGQHDHVRWYGRDYPEKLVKSGFVVEEIDYTKLFSKGQITRYGLPESEIIYKCTIA